MSVRLLCLCCPVQHCNAADPPSKESCQTCIGIRNLEVAKARRNSSRANDDDNNNNNNNNNNNKGEN
jgi:hypothetical protein